MKLVTPKYYEEFKCIAGDCTDTCCAGWDVDVDKKANDYYKSVEGAFGDRLKEVSIHDDEGGCTFRLTRDKRCPFLNSENLCDLFTELGEDKLCDTCAEFPRFINNYGGVKEMGIAPSCITAGEIIFAKRGMMEFSESSIDEEVEPNDIDPFVYMLLGRARSLSFKLINDKDYKLGERVAAFLGMNRDVQRLLDIQEDEQIGNVLKAYEDKELVDNAINTIRERRRETKKLSARKLGIPAEAKYFEIMKHYFDAFEGMEVINPDWYKVCEAVDNFYKEIKSSGKAIELKNEFNEYMGERLEEYEQLFNYTIFRYCLDAVNDYDLLLKAIICIVWYIVLKMAGLAVWYENGKEFDFNKQVDIAHLYSRQFEHSYSNFEVYNEKFVTEEIYSIANLEAICLMLD
jgi:lysine-N-methylase